MPWKSLVRMLVRVIDAGHQKIGFGGHWHLEVEGWEPGHGVGDLSGLGVPDPDVVAVVVVKCWA